MKGIRIQAKGQKPPVAAFIKALLLWCLLAVLGTNSGRAFSLLGPYTPWMDKAKSYQAYTDIGGPMCIGEGYRWNVPVLTYGFDASFLQFFGSNGVLAVESAIELLNHLPPASQLDLTNYSTAVVRWNPRAESQALLDLKSESMFLLLQHLGLAEPKRYMFCLRDSFQTNGGYQNTIIQRCFSPFSLQSSTNLNGVAFYDFVWNVGGVAGVMVFPLDASKGIRPTVADGLTTRGNFFTGLSQDDVGGLRYLYHTNHVEFETLPATVRAAGDASAKFVNGSVRPGIDKLSFVRHTPGAAPGQFSPMTNQFLDRYLSNGVVSSQQLERIITRPDFLFSVGNLKPDVPLVPLYWRTGTSNWVNDAIRNGNPERAGPGHIEPPVTITFNKLGQTLAASGDEVSFEGLIWGSYDGTTNLPIVYPQLQTEPPQMEAHLWVEFGSLPYAPPHRFDFSISAPPNAVFVLQGSSNLTTWRSLGTNSNDGTVFNFFQSLPVTPRRFYRFIPQ